MSQRINSQVTISDLLSHSEHHFSPRRTSGAGRPESSTALRTLEILTLIAESDSPVTVRELARRTGLRRDAVYRAVRSLEAASFVASGASAGTYVKGPELIRVSALTMASFDFGAIAHPIMAELAAFVRETISLHLRQGFSRMCVATVESKLPVRRIVPIGESLPIFSGPTGKAILAFLPTSDRAEALRRAEGEGQDVLRIQEQLEGIRRDGYIAAIGDRTPGVSGLSVPIFSARGVLGSLTVSGPADRWTEADMVSAAHSVSAAGAEISRMLGSISERDLPQKADA